MAITRRNEIHHPLKMISVNSNKIHFPKHSPAWLFYASKICFRFSFSLSLIYKYSVSYLILYQYFPSTKSGNRFYPTPNTLLTFFPLFKLTLFEVIHIQIDAISIPKKYSIFGIIIFNLFVSINIITVLGGNCSNIFIFVKYMYRRQKPWKKTKKKRNDIDDVIIKRCFYVSIISAVLA